MHNLTIDREALLFEATRIIEQAATDVSETVETTRKEAVKALKSARDEVSILTSEIDVLRYEVEEAERFIGYLEHSLSEFSDASLTFSELGHLKFEFCPSCFSQLKARMDDECHLCGSKITHEEDSSRVLAVRLAAR